VCLSYREIENKDVTVRKQHRCAWCAEAIYKSDAARFRVYVFDGEFTSDWMHPECYQAMLASPSEEYCDGWMAGDFERGVSPTTQQVTQSIV
jgi:hypothetical protein